MSDVTAMVLSLGEASTERAIDSVRRQSLAPAEIVVERGISPFHRAFNTALERVRTEFFVQVDADMILDPPCIEELRYRMADRVGVVAGHLRDPLLGRIIGVKLFRRQCFARLRLRDTVSPETDAFRDIRRDGWLTMAAARHVGDWRTFGEHGPEYTPQYTFCRFVRDGAKARYRKAGGGLRHVFRRLHLSGHPAATIATVAAAHGIFTRETRDLHGPPHHAEEADFLHRFLTAAPERLDPRAASERAPQRSARKEFARFYALGRELRRADAPSTFLTHMRRLHHGHGIVSWVALVALCHGLLVDADDETGAADAFAMLRDLLPGWYPWFGF